MFARLERELLKNGRNGANIYWAVMQNSTAFKLYDLNDEDNRTVRKQGTSLEYIEYEEKKTTTAITDISKHIILIFQSSVPNEYNYKVYEELNYMLSKIIYDVKMLSNGELPKINLIGHSRGGLTNLQYALDHPDLIASMFSLGTPYFGSNTAATSLGAGLATGNGRLDVINRDIYLNYFNRWYEGYDRLYSEIDAYALGGYSDSDYLFDTLIEDTSFISNYISDSALTAIKWAIKSVPGLVNSLNGTAEIVDFFVSLFRNENYSESELENYIQIIADIQYIAFDDSEWWANLLDNIVHSIPFVGCPYFMNDLFVNLSSQIGFDQHSDTYRSYGFCVYTKCYKNNDYYDGESKKLSLSNMPAIVHNLEARDEDMINYILSRISVGSFNSGYIYNQTSGTTATLSGYRGGILSGEIELPSQIDGLIIDRIDSDLFKGVGGKITSISIPSTVMYIDDNAFINMKALTTVVFQAGSKLDSIGSGAFVGCSNLQSFVIHSTVTNIAYDAFVGCSQLSSITVDASNFYYSSINGVLFNKTVTELLYYPEGKIGISYSVPLTVTEITPFAFYGNSNLTMLNLNNAGMIRQYALNGCENLATIQAPNLNYVEIGAVDGTKWLENQTSDIVKLSNVLVSYQGTASELSIENVTSIAPMAFANNETLEMVTLNNGLVNIGESAFYGCVNLEEVYICNKNSLIFVTTTSFFNNAVNRKIYIPQSLKNEYLNNELWQQYELTVHQTEIVYETNGGSCEQITGSVYYQDYLSLPIPTKEGYIFDGWYDNAAFLGEELNQETLWDDLSDCVTFYAKWIPFEYCIEYNPNGGIVTSINSYYTIEDSVEFYVPTKEGYGFDGWYYDEALTQSAGNGLDVGSTGNKSLYAKWIANTYIVTFNLNDDDKDVATISAPSDEVVFGESFTLPIPSRNGYEFNGWRTTNGELYASSNGASVKPWNIADNTMLYADWTRKQYYIRVNANGTISWLGEDGFSSTQVPIAYGTEFMTVTEIEQAFNPQKISYKEGHKFSYFTLEDGTKFTSWSEIPDLGANGTIITINANFIKETNFSIVYYSYPVSNINPLIADYNDEITLMVPPQRSGYAFRYWMVANTTDYVGNSIYVGTSLAPGTIFSYTSMPDLSVGQEADGYTICLEAYFEANTYQITISSEYGSLPYTVKNVVYNQKVTLPVLTEQGRTFLGWFTEQTDGVQITAASGEMINEWNLPYNTTLYAHWTTNVYTITYVGGYTHSNVGSFTVDDLPMSLSDGARSGYRFMGWYSDNTYDERIYQVASIGDKTFYAQWAQLYTISFTTTDGTSCSAKTGIEGETIVLPTTTRGGYKGTWSYWGYLTGNSNISNFGYSYTIGSSNVTLSVVWKEKTLSECLNNFIYEIWTYNQLNSIRNNYTTGSTYNIYGTYKLMSNITASGSWTPINYPFKGTLDGNNKQIIGLQINVNDTTSTSTVYIGMFRKVYGTIKNLKIINSTVTVSGNTAFNVGTLAGNIASYAKIINCRIYSTDENTCSVSVTGTSNSILVGGLVGYIQGGNVERSCFKGTVYVSSNGSCEAGGLVGRNTSGKIHRSWTTGNLDINSTGTSCYFNVGGLVGRNVYSSSTGDRPEIINCYSKSKVFVDCTGKTSYVYAGGLAGILNESKVNYCYATGKVTGKNKYDVSVAGGLAADIEDCVSDGFVNNVFAAGNVYAYGNYSGAETSKSFFGHFCGSEENNSFWNIYYNKDAKFKGGKTGTEVTWNTSWYNGKTVDELKSSSFQINELKLDTSIWNIVDGKYPTLK